MHTKKESLSPLLEKGFSAPVTPRLTAWGVGIIFLFSVPLIYAAFHGIRTPDETFYMSIPYRICRGDALLIDEWHAEQLSSFLQYLPMRLFLLITGGTEGIVPASRLLFCVCQTAVAVFIFLKLRKLGFISALGSALLFELYVPELVESLDYYTMTLMGYEVVALMLFFTEKHAPLKSLFTGIVVACVVVSQPFNSLVYFAYSAAVLVLLLKKRRRGADVPESLSLRHWAWMTAGILLVAVIFFTWLFAQASPAQLWENAGNLFSGEDHILPFTPDKKSDMFQYYVILQTLFSVSPVMFCSSLALTAVIFALRRRDAKTKTALAVALGAFTCLYTVVSLFRLFSSPAAMLFSPYIPAFFGINCWLLTEKKDYRLLGMWCAGAVYILCLGIISQALDYIGVIGLVVSCTVTIPMAADLFRELRDAAAKDKTAKKKPQADAVRKWRAKTAFAVSTTAVFTVWLCVFAVSHFLNDPAQAMLTTNSSAQAETIDSGPYKGVSVPKEKKEEYDDILLDFAALKEETGQPKLLITDLLPWGYFCFEKSPAAFSTWFIESELYMYEPYFETPSHLPEAIYIPYRDFFFGESKTSGANSHLAFFGQTFRYTLTEGRGGYILTELQKIDANAP